MRRNSTRLVSDALSLARPDGTGGEGSVRIQLAVLRAKEPSKIKRSKVATGEFGPN